MKFNLESRLRVKIPKIDAQFIRKAKRMVFVGTSLVRNSAIDAIQRSPKTGNSYRRGDKFHRASAPGEAPATDTGFLVSNIYQEIDANGLGGQVESRAPYSAYLEFGTVNMEARPFLFPALEANKAKIRALMLRK